MAIVTIQHRRGEYADYDPSKVLPGELVVTRTGDPNTTDGEAAYIATRAGSVKRIPFATEVEDLKTQVDDVVEDAREAIASAIDPTLTQSGKAADAKKTGDEIADLKSDFAKLKPGLSDDAKVALLNCFRHIPFFDRDADYVGTLESALYADVYPKITAVFNSGSTTIYTDDSLDSLKQYLTVKYFETADSAGAVVIASAYSLSGSLREGESIVRVTYNELLTTFTLTVVDYYNQYTWNNLAIANGNASNSGNIGIGVNMSSGALKNNRFAYTTKGLKPFEKTQDHTLTTYYPIPIPYEATGMTCNISPAERYLACYIVKYNRDTELYTTVQPAAWTQGTVTYTFDADSDQFLVVSSKYDATTSEYIGTPEINVQYTE